MSTNKNANTQALNTVPFHCSFSVNFCCLKIFVFLLVTNCCLTTIYLYKKKQSNEKSFRNFLQSILKSLLFIYFDVVVDVVDVFEMCDVQSKKTNQFR